MRKNISIIKFIAAVALMLGVTQSAAGAKHYAGGDISLLPDYEKAGAKYYDHSGKPIQDLIPWLHQQGMNAMRVRLFVNPDKYKELHANDKNEATRYDPNACQDLEYITPLCRRIVDSGMELMLDFHYSDTWADPGKQWTPIDWEGLTDEQLYQKIYDYTKETLEYLKSQGITPAFIQPGNEISYGMLWGPLGTSSPKKTLSGSDANWDRLGNLLKQAIKACREVCPEAKIVLHTERVAKPSVETFFYNKMRTMDVDYDIIGLSYYPYFHGGLNVLRASLNILSSSYPDKEIMIVETGYPYKWEVPGTTIDNTDTWKYSDEGQNKMMLDLVDTMVDCPTADGIFWWWLEYNAKGTSLSGWYNAPLFNSETGRATSALQTLCNYAKDLAVDEVGMEVPAGDGAWYNLQGIRLQSDPATSGIYIRNGKKVMIKK